MKVLSVSPDQFGLVVSDKIKSSLFADFLQTQGNKMRGEGCGIVGENATQQRVERALVLLTSGEVRNHSKRDNQR